MPATLGGHWEDRCKSPPDVDRFDTVVIAPEDLDEIERSVRFNWKANQWQAQSDDGRWEYISPVWLQSWLERCNYRGFLRLLIGIDGLARGRVRPPRPRLASWPPSRAAGRATA